MRNYVEWLDYRNDYRMYDPEKPQNTLGFPDNIPEAIEYARSAGFPGISVCDADTIKHIEEFEPEAVGEDCILEKATNCISQKEMNSHLDSLTHDEYLFRFHQEPEEYINYFDQILNHQEWKGDLSKPEQYYLEAFEKVLRKHVELYNVIRLPLHEEIPFLDREAVKLMTKKHSSLKQLDVADAVKDYSPYTIVFHGNAYGLSMCKEMTNSNVR